jgi:cbb3-type cytochrome oxidase maturation protein
VNILLFLILASLGVALLFLAAFIWAVRAGQFEDTCTPSMRILADDGPDRRPVSDSTKTNPKSP